MQIEPSESEKIDDLRQMHRQIRQLIDAKIPICLNFGNGDLSVKTWERIGKQLEAHWTDRGTTASYLADERLPKAYRDAMAQWLQGARTDALDLLTVGGEGHRFFKEAVGFVFLQTSLILSCLFLGSIAICSWLLPKMESIQAESFVQPGVGIRLLAALAHTMPYWGSFVFVTAILIFFYRQPILRQLTTWIAPMREDSFALTEFQSLFARPARFQWWVSGMVIFCGLCVLLQALSVVGVTIELLTQLVAS